jgi:hypothetical protein
MQHRVYVFILILLIALASTSVAGAATPNSGTLSKSNQEVRWTGGPFAIPNPVACATTSIRHAITSA